MKATKLLAELSLNTESSYKFRRFIRAKKWILKSNAHTISRWCWRGNWPDFLRKIEPILEGATEIHIVSSVVERKQKMIEQADLFMILPGGIGTIEELFEVWTGKHVGEYQKTAILINLNGFYNSLLIFIQDMRRNGFLNESHLSELKVVDTVSEALELAEELLK